jgi:hypothetical protein
LGFVADEGTDEAGGDGHSLAAAELVGAESGGSTTG